VGTASTKKGRWKGRTKEKEGRKLIWTNTTVEHSDVKILQGGVFLKNNWKEKSLGGKTPNVEGRGNRGGSEEEKLGLRWTPEGENRVQ